MARLRGDRAWLVVVTSTAIVAAGSLGGCPNPGTGGNGGGTGSLASTSWTGTSTYTAEITFGGTPSGQPFQKPLTVTFDAQSRPEAIDIPVANGTAVASLSTAKLVNVGDSDTQIFSLDTGHGSTTNVTITASVASVSATDTVYSATLNLTLSYGSGTISGTYTQNATLQQDGTLAWLGTGNLMVDSSSLQIPVTLGSDATLTKQ